MEALNPIEVVKGYEKLTAIFGRWPSFHDAEVISIRLERRGGDEWQGPIVYASVHVFQGSCEAGQVKWRDHAMVAFRFISVLDMSLNGFNQQNALWDLTFEMGSPRSTDVTWVGPAYFVNFQPSFGVGCSFVCASIEIDSVERAGPPGSVYA
jgi:immunity protein 50 of polymorphic toxin system